MSFASASRAAALAIPDLGIGAFFIAGITIPVLGTGTTWLILAAVLIGLVCRAVDVESWALFIPGGIPGRVERAFGPRAALFSSGAVFLERLMAAALACEVFGHYSGTAAFAVFGIKRFLRQATIADVSTAAALIVLGYLWIRARTGHLLGVTQRARHIWIAAAAVFVLVVDVWITGFVRVGWPGFVLPPVPAPLHGLNWSNPTQIEAALTGLLAGLAFSVPAIGSGDGLWRVAWELEPPRLRGLRRTAVIVGAFALVATAFSAVLFSSLVPLDMQQAWTSAPLLGLAAQLATPAWLGTIVTLSLLVAAGFMLAQAARAALTSAETLLTRLSAQGIVSSAFRDRASGVRHAVPRRRLPCRSRQPSSSSSRAAGSSGWRARTRRPGRRVRAALSALLKLRTRPVDVAIPAATGRRTSPRPPAVGALLWGSAGLLVLVELVLVARRDPPSSRES